MKLCENFLKTLYTQFNPPFQCIWLVFIYCIRCTHYLRMNTSREWQSRH